jgi:TetR/AcrR family transcriptional repressor of nem operon
MGRVSQAQALENRRRVVATAARLFRAHGVAGVSVADLMSAAGLTHGGFYKQFPSKEALVAEAVGAAFTDRAAWLRDLAATAGDDARQQFVDGYLSAAHRDDPGGGCPAAGLGADMAREPDASPARAAYTEGVRAYARWLHSPTTPTAEATFVTAPGTAPEAIPGAASEAAPGTAPGGPSEATPGTAPGGPSEATPGAIPDSAPEAAPGAAVSDADLAAVSTLVGAIVLARATAGTDLSDQILTAARNALTPEPR